MKLRYRIREEAAEGDGSPTREEARLLSRR